MMEVGVLGLGHFRCSCTNMECCHNILTFLCVLRLAMCDFCYFHQSSRISWFKAEISQMVMVRVVKVYMVLSLRMRVLTWRYAITICIYIYCVWFSKYWVCAVVLISLDIYVMLLHLYKHLHSHFSTLHCLLVCSLTLCVVGKGGVWEWFCSRQCLSMVLSIAAWQANVVVYGQFWSRHKRLTVLHHNRTHVTPGRQTCHLRQGHPWPQRGPAAGECGQGGGKAKIGQTDIAHCCPSFLSVSLPPLWACMCVCAQVKYLLFMGDIAASLDYSVALEYLACRICQW